MSDKIRPPWTLEQVAALNEFQRRGGMHPFTCGGEHSPGSPKLIAHVDGWHCSDPYSEGCDWTQDWAHAFMANPEKWPRSPFGDRQPTPQEIRAVLPDHPPYPYSDGSRAVLGPDVYASADGNTIEWQGAIYRRHPDEAHCGCGGTSTQAADLRSAFNNGHGDGLITDPPGSSKHRLTALGRQALTGIAGVIAYLPGQACSCGGVWPDRHRDGRRHEPVETDHGPSVVECAANDAAHWADKYAGEDT
jgi:hypothetical protein